MKKLQEIRDSIAYEARRAEEILASESEPSEKTLAEAKVHLDKVDALKDELAKAEKADADAKAVMQRASEAKAWLGQSQGRKTSPGDGSPPEKAATSGLKERITEDPQAGWRDFNEFAAAVHEGSRYGVMPESYGERAALGNNTFNGEDGGFLIAKDFSNSIIERAYTQAPVLEKCDRLTLAGNSIDIPGMSDADRNAAATRHGGVVVYWVGEGDEITRSSPKFRQVSLKLNKLGALAYTTGEYLQDVANGASRLMDKMGSAVADELVEAVMFGNGVAKPLGAINAANAARLSTAAENGQVADTVNLENVLKMQDNLWGGSEAGADWYANKELRNQLRLLKQDIGTGGAPVPLFEGGSPARLDGRPIYFTDHCEAAGDAGDICLADFGQYFLATKGTPEMAVSMHLRFHFHEDAFRITFRVDGRPAWEASLRPRKGAAAKRESPFVVLAAR